MALAAVVVAIIWLTGRRPQPLVSPSGKPAVAVLYFENNTGDASLDWMRTGLTDMMVTDLSQSTDIEVLGTDRLHQILQDLKRTDDRTISSDVVQRDRYSRRRRQRARRELRQGRRHDPDQREAAGRAHRTDRQRRESRGHGRVERVLTR